MRAHSTVVLLIEDNPADQRLVSEALADAGVDCELRVISNGAQALQSAREIGTEESAGVPALIILDLHLPCVDGSEILTALRNNPACDRTPLITVSSSLTPAEAAFLKGFLNVIHVHKSAALEQFFVIGRIVADVLATKRCSYDGTSIEQSTSSSSP
jgi:two-component system, chemotaxis family, response regulator Rcp1